MYAFSGILTSLLQRAATGRAPAVEVSLFEALAEWLGSPAYYTAYGGRAPERAGGEHATIAPYGPYPTADGDVLLIAVQNDREWARFCAGVLGDGELGTEERFARNSSRVANRAELNKLIAARLAALGTGTAVELLDAAGIANARLRTVPQFLEHPVLAGRGRWQDVETPGGPVRALLPPVTLAGVTPRMDPVPAVGEHSAAILRALGRTEAAIERLRADGII
jgi:formyl-CoA transferase